MSLPLVSANEEFNPRADILAGISSTIISFDFFAGFFFGNFLVEKVVFLTGSLFQSSPQSASMSSSSPSSPHPLR